MKLFPIILILFGLIIIFNPNIIAYLIGGFFVFVGVSTLGLSGMFGSSKSHKGEEFIKFGKYKIYR